MPRLGPVKVLSFLGLEIDVREWTVRVPRDKVEKGKALVDSLLQSSKSTLSELQQVIGFLSFLTTALPYGRAFLRRLINRTIGLREPHHHVRRSAADKGDLNVWRQLLAEFNGKAIILPEHFLLPDATHVATDASKVGFGGVHADTWFYGAWAPAASALNITTLELYPIVAMFAVLRHKFAGRRVRIDTDNESLVHCINKSTSNELPTMALLRELVSICLINNIYIRASISRT